MTRKMLAQVLLNFADQEEGLVALAGRLEELQDSLCLLLETIAGVADDGAAADTVVQMLATLLRYCKGLAPAQRAEACGHLLFVLRSCKSNVSGLQELRQQCDYVNSLEA